MRLWGPETALNSQPSNPGLPACTGLLREGGDGNTLAHSGLQGLLGATFSDWHFHVKDQWCIRTPILINQKWNPYLTEHDKNHWFKKSKD